MSNRPLVLLVEDQQVWQMVIKDELQEAGYRVHVASSYDEALAEIEHEKPGLIILDILLSSVSTGELLGLDLGRTLAEADDTKHIPRIYATVVGIDNVRTEALKSAERVFVKPFDLSEFRAEVARLLPLSDSAS